MKNGIYNIPICIFFLAAVARWHSGKYQAMHKDVAFCYTCCMGRNSGLRASMLLVLLVFYKHCIKSILENMKMDTWNLYLAGEWVVLNLNIFTLLFKQPSAGKKNMAWYSEDLQLHWGQNKGWRGFVLFPSEASFLHRALTQRGKRELGLLYSICS